MLIKALEKIIINGTIIGAGETYDGAAEELDAYISGGYVEVLEQDEDMEVLEQDEDMEDDPADNQNEEVDQEDEEPEETPKERPKTTRKTVRRTKKTGA